MTRKSVGDGDHRLLDPHTAWSIDLFASLKDGGVWVIPRSGLNFRRYGDELVLTDRMPHMAEMPVTAAELDKIQNADYELIREKFAKAGITVRRQN